MRWARHVLRAAWEYLRGRCPEEVFEALVCRHDWDVPSMQCLGDCGRTAEWFDAHLTKVSV